MRTPTLAACACALALPGPASAATLAVTADDGTGVPVSPPPTLRSLAPKVIPQLAPGEGNYSLTVTGPTGQDALEIPQRCRSASNAAPADVAYAGNGAYQVVLTAYGDRDFSCSNAPVGQASGGFAIDARTGVVIQPNQRVVLTRDPGSFVTKEVRLGFVGVAGADTFDIQYARAANLAPDGSILAGRDAFLDRATGLFSVRADTPGVYSVVSRARTFGTPGGATPWSAPVQFRAFAPFDLQSLTFPDARGPSYRLTGDVREDRTRGRVSIAFARGWTGRARYRSAGRATLRTGARFTKRFRLRRTGRYRVRFRFAGNSTTAPGTIVQRITIRRIVTFGFRPR